jgi:hypothetical protein
MENSEEVEKFPFTVFPIGAHGGSWIQPEYKRFFLNTAINSTDFQLYRFWTF